MSEAKSQSLPIVSPVRDQVDRWTFILFVLCGAGAIIALREVGVDPLLVMTVPASLIVFYAAVALVAKRLRLREDRVADNCYYMGFIFTLVSLAYALYGFHYGGSITDELIQDFGIALSSTIFGVILRLILTQFRTDPVEIEREAHAELASAAQNLRSEMQQALTDFKGYRVAMHQSFDEAMTEVRNRSEDSVAKTTSRFEEVVETLVGRIESTFEAHAENARKLTDASSKTVEALESVIRRIEEIEAPSDLVEQKLAPAVEEIRKAAEAVNKRAAADGREVQRLSKIVESAVQGAETLDQRLKRAAKQEEAGTEARQALVQELHSLKESVAAVREAAEASEQLMAQAGESARASQDMLQGLKDSAQATLQEVREHNAALGKALGESRAMTLKVHSELTDLANRVTRRLDGEPAKHSAEPARAGAQG